MTTFRDGWGALTEAEREIMVLRCRGFYLQDIAELRSTSRVTVRNHITSALAKLQPLVIPVGAKRDVMNVICWHYGWETATSRLRTEAERSP